MARIRSIKPEFPQSESMGRVSRDARLCFIELWTIADDSGRLRGNSRMLASLLFPYDNDAPLLIEGWLEELERESCIARYSIQGNSYIQICKWQEHQKIDKPTKSKIPQFDESSRALDESSRSVVGGSKDQGRDLRIKEGIKEPGAAAPDPTVAAEGAGADVPAAAAKRRKEAKTRVRLCELSPESLAAFEAVWDERLRQVTRWDERTRAWVEADVNAGSKAMGERNFQRIVDSRLATPRELYACWHLYLEDAKNKGFVQMVATFFGPEKATWREYLELARVAIFNQDAQEPQEGPSDMAPPVPQRIPPFPHAEGPFLGDGGALAREAS